MVSEKMRSSCVSWLFCTLLLGLSGESFSSERDRLKFQDASAVVWAVNLGGSAHQAADGIRFEADPIEAGKVGSVAAVRGAQDQGIYLTYREGELVLEHPLPNGLYDLTFYFAEPHDAAPGDRIFDVLAQGHTVIDALDVSASRSSSDPSALNRIVTGVAVTGGILRLELKAIRSTPFLSAVSVRARKPEEKQWTLVWSDEFDYQGPPDSEKWIVDQWAARKVNDEDQAYTNRPMNVRVDGDKLILQAHKESYQGGEYTSGRVHSRGRGDILYGRIDVRAKLPAGQGLWSAIWMLPTDPYHYATDCEAGEEWQGNPDCDAWPNSGEIDIMEHVGYDMKRVHSTVHNHRFFSSGPDLRNASIEVEDVTQYHIYSLDWTPEQIRVFVDGVEFYRYLKQDGDWKDWPFDQPFHLIINLAVGGLWGRAGGPINPEVFPASMEIDYVRVFEPLVSR